MVLVHIKRTPTDQFIIDTPCSTPVTTLRERISKVTNLRIKLDRLLQSVQDLMSHGPLRPEALRGLTSPETINPAIATLPKDQLFWANSDIHSPDEQDFRPDETGYRTGVCPSKKIADNCIEQISPFRDLLDVKKADKRIPVSEKELEHAIEMIRASIMIVYPGYNSLPPWDFTLLILEDNMNYAHQWPDAGWIVTENISLWWAKKELSLNKLISHYIGKNEKTKIIVKLGGKGQGAPLAEPPVDQETQKKMMAYYYKKQEQMKKLDENVENEHMNSTWANPKFLKNQIINGGQGIRWK